MKNRQRGWLSPLLWLVAVLLTVSLAGFQRLTGPSYPVRGELTVQGRAEAYALPRSHAGPGALEVELPAPAETTRSAIRWRRFPTEEPWREVAMLRDGTRLVGELPHQPPAGKVEYAIELEVAGQHTVVPAEGTVVARFRGAVPAAVLVPHILGMFLSMLVSTRALLEVLHCRERHGRGLVIVAMGLLVVGGLILGPVVQKFAFGAFWTGWPLGHDLTDNKTLIAFLAWLPATIVALVKRPTRWPVVAGWTVMMAVFLIPHSLHGSQIDWQQQIETSEVAETQDPVSGGG